LPIPGDKQRRSEPTKCGGAGTREGERAAAIRGQIPTTEGGTREGDTANATANAKQRTANARQRTAHATSNVRANARANATSNATNARET
jgi:hypothetical protein